GTRHAGRPRRHRAETAEALRRRGQRQDRKRGGVERGRRHPREDQRHVLDEVRERPQGHAGREARRSRQSMRDRYAERISAKLITQLGVLFGGANIARRFTLGESSHGKRSAASAEGKEEAQGRREQAEGGFR